MEQNPVIFDISSDEEPAFGDPQDDDRDWLSEVLGAVDRQMSDGDSDEVVFVGEVNPRKKSESAVKDFGGGGNCDDCIVLEGDPDKPLELATDSKEDSDECLVVGEKGQVACRDFPHPRHDCALYPFSSTPHEKHCELCHCFVCDERAPCAFWGSGTSSSDHCDANDKNDTWQLLRKNFRQGSKVPNPSPAMAMPQFNQAQHSRITRLLSDYRPQQLVGRPVKAHSGNPMVQDQLLRSSTPRGCSSTARQGVPSITNQVRSRLPGSVWSRSPMQQRPMPQQLVGVRNTVIWKVQGRNELGSPFVPCSTQSKRVDAGGTPAANQSTNSSSDGIVGHASGHRENVTSTTALHDRIFNELLELISGGNSGIRMPQSAPQPNVTTGFTGTVPSQPPVASVPVAQSNTGQHISLAQNEILPVPIDDLADLDYGWVTDVTQSGQQPLNSNFQCQNMESTEDQLLATVVNESGNFVFDEVDLPEFDFENHHVHVEGAPGEVCMSPELWGFDSDVQLFNN